MACRCPALVRPLLLDSYCARLSRRSCWAFQPFVLPLPRMGTMVIPPDPALRVHQLDNGMRVWIRPNANPPIIGMPRVTAAGDLKQAGASPGRK